MIDINLPTELETESPLNLEAEELLDLTPMEEDVIENDDGSASIMFEEDTVVPQMFEDNLAEGLSESFLKELASDLLENIEYDKKAREKRDEQYQEGIRRSGLGDDAPGGAKFDGASKVVHPVLAESCIDFAARAIKELFPANGPVKTETEGLLSPPEEMQVKALSKCLNDQFLHRIPNYRSIFEQELTQLPLGGSQFIKFYVDMKKRRICAEFIPIDDVFVPFYSDSYYDAERATHRQYLSQSKIDERIKTGQYRDIKLVQSVIEPERSSSAVASDKVEGKDNVGFNEDNVRPIYECYTELIIEDDQFGLGEKVPYIISIDPLDENILSIYRNWDQNDPSFSKEEWIVEDKFIPWRGAYGVGLPHLIGSLSGAATGALRALLDSAHINNVPTLVKLKQGKLSGQTKSIDVTQVAELEGPVGMDDIRKLMMPMPFNPPSQVLLQLLGWLTDAAKGVVSTASEKIAEATSNTPVGTTQALIEQGAIIFSSIHARLHYSQAKKFEIVLRLLKKYLPEVLQEYNISPETVNMKGVRPVSDPNIFSEAQRMSQLQSVLKLSETAPELYNKAELHKNALSLLKVNNFERFLLPPPPAPQPMDPAKELLAFLQNIPVAVVEQQDHMSHIIVHVNYLKDPMFGMNPIMVPVTIKVLDHLRDHLTHFMAARLSASAMQSMQIHQQQVQQIQQQQMQLSLLGDPSLPPQLPQLPPPPPAESVMAQASDKIVEQDIQIASQAFEVIQQVTEFVKTESTPKDPSVVVGMAEVERKRQKDAQDVELANRREDNLRNLEAAEKLEKREQVKFDQMLEQLRLEHDQKIQLLQQKVELMKNDDDNRQHQLTELLKNHDDNRTSIMIEQIRQAVETAIPKPEMTDDKSYIADLQNLIKEVQSAESENKLSMIMQGLQATIQSVRAPRKNTPIRDDNGNLVGSISQIEDQS